MTGLLATPLYVALAVKKWSGLTLNLVPVWLEGGPGVGFLVAYATEAEAEAAYPGARIVRLVSDEQQPDPRSGTEDEQDQVGGP